MLWKSFLMKLFKFIQKWKEQFNDLSHPSTVIKCGGTQCSLLWSLDSFPVKLLLLRLAFFPPAPHPPRPFPVCTPGSHTLYTLLTILKDPPQTSPLSPRTELSIAFYERPRLLVQTLSQALPSAAAETSEVSCPTRVLPEQIPNGAATVTFIRHARGHLSPLL